MVESGKVERQIEAEQYIIELILKHKNIHLFSFNNRTDITTDLNNYKDEAHYGAWINSLILKWMHEGKYLLTEDNYKTYLQEEYSFYTTFDYSGLDNQTDYESDFYAAALLNKELTGEEPIEILSSGISKIDLSDAEIVNDQYEGTMGIQCATSEGRSTESQEIVNKNLDGNMITVDDIGHHRYFVFYGKKLKENSKPIVTIYDEKGKEIAEIDGKKEEIKDDCWHQYVINLPEVSGGIQIVFSVGYSGNDEYIEPVYVFSDLKLY